MATKIRCHYEILGVERTAMNDDFKKAYRKLALKFHPDKNPDNVEEATEQFRLVQQAYEVLTDPQERAWYDKHREAILRGGQGQGDQYEDESLNLFQYFTSTCYQGYKDDEKGFYAVYRGVFNTLSEEDYVFMDDKESDYEFPEFGTSQTDYEEVVRPFYDFWHAFCTSKSYVWVEKYDTREAPDRRTRRLMEAENKKLRDAAKKERNEEIRALVAFVRKRDKRVQAYKKLLEERAAEIEKKTKEKQEKDIQERLRRQQNYKETGWSAMSGLESHLQKLEADLAQQFGDHSGSEDGEESTADTEGAVSESSKVVEEDEEEDYYNNLFCVACNKAFKSEKAMSNHEKSKKHKEMVAILRAQLEEEEEEIEGEEADTEGGNEETEADVQINRQKLETDLVETGGGEMEEEGGEEEFVDRAKLSKKQKKKRRQKVSDQAEEERNETDMVTHTLGSLRVTNSNDGEDENSQRTTKSKKNRRKEKKNAAASAPEQENGETATSAEMSDQTQDSGETVAANKTEDDDTAEANTEGIDVTESGSAQPDTADTTVSDKARGKQDNTEYVSRAKAAKVKESLACAVCRQAFQSRNKLFEHIKMTGHAIPLSAKQSATTSEPTDSGRKRNKKTGKQ